MDLRSPPRPIYRFGDYRLDAARMTLHHADIVVPTTPRVLSALLYLVENAGETVSRDELLNALWPGRYADEANLSQAISAVRRLLSARGAAESIILTVPGRGYRFTPPVTTLPGEPQAAAVFRPAESQPRSRPEQARRSRKGKAWLLVPLGVAGIVVVAGAAWRHAAKPRLAPGRTGVVLADLENFTADPSLEHLVTPAMRITLAQSPFLQVATDAQTSGTLALMNAPKNGAMTPALARDVCNRLNGGAVIATAIYRLSTHYLLTASATDCINGRPLASTKVEAKDKDGIVQAIDRLSSRTRRALGETRDSVAKFDVPILPAHTGSFEALQAYSEAVWLHDHGKIADSIDKLHHAVEIDPGFAAAFSLMSSDYYISNQPEKDAAAIQKAYDLRSTVSEPQKIQIVSRYNMVVTKDVDAALENLVYGTRVYPRDVTAWSNLSNLQNQMGDYEGAISSGRRALSLNDGVLAPYSVLARALNHAGRPAEAVRIDQQAIAKGVSGGDTRGQLIADTYLAGDMATSDRLVAQARGTPLERDALLEESDIAVMRGRLREAETLWARAEALGRADNLHLSYTEEAFAYATVGLMAQARTWLEKTPAPLRTGRFHYYAALLDDPAKVEADLAGELARWPRNTFLREQYAPMTRAALLLRRGRPELAVQALDGTDRFMFRDLQLPYLKATAFLAARHGPEAAAAFRAVLVHRGLNPDGEYELAHLGLARALRLQGDVAGSRSEYRAFLKAWSAADPDLPPMVQARVELSQLDRSGEARNPTDHTPT